MSTASNGSLPPWMATSIAPLAGRRPQRCWAVEGAHGVGRPVAQRLVGDGEQVLDVPAKLAARVRVLSVGHGRKSDPDDAVAVAGAARSAPSLRQVAVENQAVVLHLLTKRRQDLVAARTQTINRLHRLLVELVPAGAGRNLTAKRAAALLGQGQPPVWWAWLDLNSGLISYRG